jgi:hypothetical protein
MRHTWKLQIRVFPRNKVNKKLIWFCVKVGEGVLEQKKLMSNASCSSVGEGGSEQKTHG